MGTDDKWEWWVVPFFLFAVAWHCGVRAAKDFMTIALRREGRKR